MTVAWNLVVSSCILQQRAEDTSFGASNPLQNPHSHYTNYLVYCCDQIPERSYSSWERFIFAYSLRKYGPSRQGSHSIRKGGVWSPCICSQQSTVSKQRGESWISASLYLFMEFGAQPMKWCYSHLGWIFPLENPPQTPWRCVSMVILVKLTMKISHHGHCDLWFEGETFPTGSCIWKFDPQLLV